MLENVASATVLVAGNEGPGRSGQGQSPEARDSAGVGARRGRRGPERRESSSTVGHTVTLLFRSRPRGVPFSRLRAGGLGSCPRAGEV